jgi:tight adherence protein B
MDGSLLYILIALVAGLLVLGLIFLIQGFTDTDKRKLSARLSSGDERVDANTVTRRSIIVQQMESAGLPPGLANMKAMQGLHRRVMQAYPDLPLPRFLLIVAGMGVITFLLVGLLADSMLMGAISGGVAAYIPFFLVNSRRNKRQRTLADQLPDALDFLARILKAGHSLTTGLQMMGEELAQPMGTEFRRAYGQHSLGQSLEDSLKDMSTRIESTDFAFFITAVLIQRQTGGDLSEVLTNISGMIRQRIRLQAHVKAKTAEGRFTGYILVAFPAVMFVIAWAMNPSYAGILLHTTRGMELLCTAFGLQMLGLWAIRKLTTVRV